MRIALISDIHEDIINLQKAFQKIENLNCDKIYCLGDISGYGLYNYNYFERRNASECLRLIKESCELIVLGNHDLQAIQKLPQNLGGFIYPENWYSLDYSQKKELANDSVWLYEDELDPLYSLADISFLRQKSEYEIIHNQDVNVLFSHYSFPNLTGSLREFSFESGDYFQHFNFMEKRHCNLSFIGHEHAEGILVIKQNKIVQKGFFSYKLTDFPAIIILPAIVKGNKSSGFLIYDSSKQVIEAIKI